MITEPTQNTLLQTQQAAHAHCIVCGSALESGLGLKFVLCDDGSVEAHFECHRVFQGYDGMLHGGVTSTLLDGAMTNCLFAHGLVAVTAEMTVRFRHPIEVGVALIVRARIIRSQLVLHALEAELIQNGQVKAKAEGKFMEKRAGTIGI